MGGRRVSEIYLNGQFMPAEQARISPLDRGFLFADSVYEVVPAYDGRLFRFEQHLARLERSLGEVQIDNPHSRDEWRGLCETLLSRNGGGNRSVYLHVSRGEMSKRDHAFPQPPLRPTVFLMASPMAAPVAAESASPGCAVITRDDIRWHRCDIKSAALLANILLRQQAAEQGAAEVVLVRGGEVTEGSTSNVFAVIGGVVATPPKSSAILGGVTRDLVIELCRRDGIAVEERSIGIDELRGADEIWLTSSTREITPVVKLDDHPVGAGTPGPAWREMTRRYAAYKQDVHGAPA